MTIGAVEGEILSATFSAQNNFLNEMISAWRRNGVGEGAKQKG